MTLTLVACGDDSSIQSGKPETAKLSKPRVQPPNGASPKKLLIKDLEEGSGPAVRAGDEITVQYVGVDKNGKEIFDSWDREPITFKLGGGDMIQGWEEGLEGMKLGGRRELIIPSNLAGRIGTLVYVVDLLTVDRTGAMSNADQLHAKWVRQADQLCSQATDRLRQMPPVYTSTYGSVVPAMARNERALAEELRALEVPEEDQPSIERLAGLLDRQSKEVDAAAVTYGTEGEFAAYERHVQRARDLDAEIEAAARSLGASACAQPPVRAGYL